MPEVDGGHGDLLRIVDGLPLAWTIKTQHISLFVVLHYILLSHNFPITLKVILPFYPT
jgi:hypothetical protein